MTRSVGIAGERGGEASERSTTWDPELERHHATRAQQGDKDSLRVLLEHYGPVVYRCVLLPRLGNPAHAQDALGDTYTRVILAIGRYQWRPGGFFPWLRTIALNIAIDQLRRRKRETPFDVDPLARELDRRSVVAETDIAYFEAEERQLITARIEGALGRIHFRYATAIRLRVLEDRSREDVAHALSCSPATFDVLLHRAMAALRKELTLSTSVEK